MRDNSRILSRRSDLPNRRALQLLTLVVLSAALASSHFAFAQSAPTFDGKRWWEYVKVLADDNMEGRETGSPGLQRASAYVVEQLKKDGLQPAGSKGYYQPVKLVSREIDESASSMELVRDGKHAVRQARRRRHVQHACRSGA